MKQSPVFCTINEGRGIQGLTYLSSNSSYMSRAETQPRLVLKARCYQTHQNQVKSPPLGLQEPRRGFSAGAFPCEPLETDGSLAGCEGDPACLSQFCASCLGFSHCVETRCYK